MSDAAPPAAAGAQPVEAFELSVDKRGVALHVYRKRIDDGQRRPVLFLVHGSSYSGRTSYDLTVPGREGYSMMDAFARRGFDVWTMDHEGYGRSGSGSGNSDIAAGIEDLALAARLVAAHTGEAAAAYYGQSSGALRAAAFAGAHPGRVTHLALAAFVWTGRGSPTLARRRERLAEWQSSNRRAVDEAFYTGTFERDRPGYNDPEVPAAIAAAERAFGATVPTGTYLDMCANLPVVDPARIRAPVLLLRGEHDGIASEEDLLAFYTALPVKDKRFVMMAGQAHATHLGVNRHRLYHLLENFLHNPARHDSRAAAPGAGSERG